MVCIVCVLCMYSHTHTHTHTVVGLHPPTLTRTGYKHLTCSQSAYKYVCVCVCTVYLHERPIPLPAGHANASVCTLHPPCPLAEHEAAFIFLHLPLSNTPGNNTSRRQPRFPSLPPSPSPFLLISPSLSSYAWYMKKTLSEGEGELKGGRS